MAVSIKEKLRFILKSAHTKIIKEISRNTGFSGVGIARAGFMEEEARRLEYWLNQGVYGEMEYMARHFDLRTDPTQLVPGAKSVISLLHNYFPKDDQTVKKSPRISKYAWGKDYHMVLRKKLQEFFAQIQLRIGDVSGRVFVDSAPVLEREWAVRSGLGWMGKNTLLINPKQGSFFFLAEIICDLELDEDPPIKDYCGTCRKCIIACPTGAIRPEGYHLETNQCISYLTIEHRSAIPDEFKGKMEDYIFGCDICQDVCPWNRFAKPHNEVAFIPENELLNWTKSEWIELTQEVFNHLFKDSAVKRTKYSGLKRNIDFLYK